MKGVFVGLATLDVVQLAQCLPEPWHKGDSARSMIAAGGPAANAAVAFAHGYTGSLSGLMPGEEDDA